MAVVTDLARVRGPDDTDGETIAVPDAFGALGRLTGDDSPLAHEETLAERRHAAAQMLGRLIAPASADSKTAGASGPHDALDDRQHPVDEARTRIGEPAGVPSTEKRAYSYTVLRYVLDVVSEERLNVGVVMHAPASRLLMVRTRKTAGRLKQAFPDLDAAAFAGAMAAVERGLDALVHQADLSLGDVRTDARSIAVRVLPDDDSALRWSPAGSGLTANPARTFERLYARYVTRYDASQAAGGG